MTTNTATKNMDFLLDLDVAIEDIAESWGENIETGRSFSLCDNGERAIMLVSGNNIKNGVLCESGNIYKICKVTENKTGNITWNGDDEYFNEIEITYSVGSLVDTVESLKEIKSVNSKAIEKIASEIISVVCQ